MDKMKLLIGDANEEFTGTLVNHLQGIFHIRTCADGHEALELLLSCRPDILVLDLMLPGLDGISLLQAASAAGQRPTVLATTRFASDYMLESLSRLGVGYLMIKPCDVKATVERIMDLSRQLKAPLLSRPDPRTAAANLLLNLGIRTKLKGYTNLREAIPMVVKNPGISLTKELYPAVGALCNASSEQVERAIRGAIQSAWLQRDEQVWRMYFQPGKNGRVPRPTNGAFITRLADCLMSGQEEADTDFKKAVNDTGP